MALGKACSHSLNLSETPIVTPKECYDTPRKLVKVKRSTVSYYATKLADEGYLKRVKRGKYVFNVDKLDDFLEELKLVSASC